MTRSWLGDHGTTHGGPIEFLRLFSGLRLRDVDSRLLFSPHFEKCAGPRSRPLVVMFLAEPDLFLLLDTRPIGLQSEVLRYPPILLAPWALTPIATAAPDTEE